MNDIVKATPSDLLQIAVEKGATVDHLEKLMDMQLRWEANEARKAFVQAMADFKAEAPQIEKSKAGYDNRYHYAPLDQITKAIGPILAKHGLSFSWVAEQGDQITVHCDVTHVHGHTQRVSLSGSPDTSGSKNAIQAVGSALSYLQRYTLLSSLGLATSDQDNDGGGPRVNPDQLSSLRKMADKHGVMDSLMAWLAEHDVTELEQVPAKSFGNCVKKINALAKAKREQDESQKSD